LVPGSVLFSCVLAARKVDNFFRRRGSPPVLRRAADHFVYSLRPALVETRLDGLRFQVRVNDPFHYDAVLGGHETRIEEWLDRNVKPGMVVFDVGANNGSYTLRLARLVGSGGRVIAFEPDPDIAALLAHNIESNSFSQATVVRGAAYRESGTIRLGRAVASSSYSGLYYDKASEWIDVSAYTLDSVAQSQGLERLDLVKIDAEGAEDDVVIGMSALLQTLRPAILVELHDWHGAPTQQLPAKLRSLGYDVEMLSETHALAKPR
jgi:FkbM family methyltransferase